MGSGSIEGFRRIKAIPDRVDNFNPTLVRSPIAASHATVSAALVQEKQDGQAKKQVPVYFVSEVLSPSKKNYTELEKVLYDVLRLHNHDIRQEKGARAGESSTRSNC